MIDHVIYMDNIEDIVLTKYFIETKLTEKNESFEKMSLNDFIGKFIDMTKTVAAYNINSAISDVVPFFIYVLDNDRYIFFVEKNDKTNLTLKKLQSINYDLSKLNKYSGTDNMLRVEGYSYDF